MTVIMLVFIAIGVAFFGFIVGERVGVRDTERRWSDAVSRADAHRRQQKEQSKSLHEMSDREILHAMRDKRLDGIR